MFEIFILVVLTIFTLVGLVTAFGWKNLHYRLLARELVKWQQQGWVSPEAASAILADSRPKGLADRLVFLVGLLGAILLLFAALSFVAANWENMSRLARLTWLMALLWISFLTGWRLTANNLPRLAELAWLAGVGLFGVNIALVAQMFHIDSHAPNGVLMWTIGALAVAALLRSRAALALTFGGAIVWSLMEIIGYSATFHWPFLPVWGAAVALTFWLQWKPARHLAFLSFFTWFTVALSSYALDASWAVHGVLTMFVLTFLLLLAISFVWQGNRSELGEPGFETWLERYGLIGLLPSLFLLQTLPLATTRLLGLEGENSPDSAVFAFLHGDLGWLSLAVPLLVATLVLLFLTWREKLLRLMDMLVFAAIALASLVFALVSSSGGAGFIDEKAHAFLSTWIFGAAFIAVLVWLIEFGHRRGSDLYVWAALATFAAEVLYIYFRIFGSLLETSLFFLVGGVLTMGLAFFLYRLHKRLDSSDHTNIASHQTEVPR